MPVPCKHRVLRAPLEQQVRIEDSHAAIVTPEEDVYKRQSYSRDLSAKIAAADHVMQKKGMYLGGYRPFGFLSDPNDCHKLILDPVASRYVRLISELALQGNSCLLYTSRCV